jgi:hypothetical protein
LRRTSSSTRRRVSVANPIIRRACSAGSLTCSICASIASVCRRRRWSGVSHHGVETLTLPPPEG